MEVRKYQEEYFESLFSYWKNLGEKVPFFFPVSPARWRECMFEDKLDSEKIFSTQETFVAEENRQILGFIQYGQPTFAWDENGQKYSSPQIGIIRHFYFETGRFDVANLLFAEGESYLEQFPTQHAFYHTFGMSCNAHHGKLHESLAHVGQFLCEKGFQIEHENLYYSLELKEDEVPYQNELILVSKPDPKPNLREYEIRLQETPIGVIQIRFLEGLTGGATADTVYMTWIGINDSFRRQGWGSKAMKLLIADLQSEGCHQLHLDTASINEGAQQFYEHYGFENRGRTRCFVKQSIGELPTTKD